MLTLRRGKDFSSVQKLVHQRIDGKEFTAAS